ncbi:MULTISPECIES: hypothetical protein [unclassified Aureimonas]|uniref:hypothetical protein n=1 Tax=unclassified Aureimonas TaxID=2615206 RepID=UPI0006F862F1|nr:MULTISPECIES: hypothetical protein [unclassified Aureimonas]KQT70017.1 hypothetical protein ASG62_02705 [Aureimonas sp. Leaf427]KQT75828.1 hypothetical protein ASG54_13510 [Aureimonas sp. Leaf460]
MTCFPAHRRDLACRTCSDDEVLIGPAVVLPDLPEPGPVARVILALFEGSSFGLDDVFEDEVEIIVPAPRRLH